MKRNVKRTVKIVLLGLAAYIYGYNRGIIDARQLYDDPTQKSSLDEEGSGDQ